MALYIDGQEVVESQQEIITMPEHRWYPVYCRPKKEKIFFETFATQGATCYMPEVMRHRITRGKRITTPVAMFTGYVFVCTDRMQNWEIKKSKYVLRVLPVSEYDETRLVSELNIIRAFEDLARKQKVEVRPDFVPGKKVVITQGRLQGIEGIVLKRKNAVEIVINLDFMGQTLATIEAYDLDLA